jgi:pimeloyl-ACP methyl ester carboxylesterase
MPKVDVNGIALHYEEQGGGEPILLIMGLATQLIAWPPTLLDGLAESGFRVIRFDNRDIGLSAKTEGPPPVASDLLRGVASKRLAKSDYLLSDMADDAAGLIEALGLEKSHVVGVSMGGMIAQELAIRHPDKVATLTSIMSNTGSKRHGRPAASFYGELRKSFLGPRPTNREEAVEVGLNAWKQISGPHLDEAELRSMIETAIERDPDPIGRVRQIAAILASPDRTSSLRELDVPTLVIHGLIDRLVTPSGGVATAKAIRGSRLLMFPDMAHDLPRPRIPEILDAIVTNARRAPVPAAP